MSTIFIQNVPIDSSELRTAARAGEHVRMLCPKGRFSQRNCDGIQPPTSCTKSTPGHSYWPKVVTWGSPCYAHDPAFEGQLKIHVLHSCYRTFYIDYSLKQRF
jgi:hypothetical protein